MGLFDKKSASPILQLHEVSTNRQLVGGKAAQLGQLTRANLPVPEGFCLTTTVFDAFMAHHQLEDELRAIHRGVAAKVSDKNDVETRAQGLAARIIAADMPSELEKNLKRRWSVMGNAAVSVRSSAIHEDHENASFAGLFDTILGVESFEDLLDAIRRCWASLISDAALSYMREKDLNPGRMAMAVVIQRMLSPQSSGVLFTVNPVNGSRREMVLDAGWGLGEAYVSGQASADNFLLSRPFRPDPKASLKVLHRVIVPKVRMMVNRRGHSPDWQAVPQARQKMPTLSPDDIERVGRLGLAAERLFGTPRDLEWAMEADGSLYVLQARPITTGRRAFNHHRRDDVLWTNRFSGERWTTAATPMGWSIIAPILSYFVFFENASKDFLKGSLPVRLYRGHPYFNITIFRHLLVKWPGSPPPQFILELFPKKEQDEILHAPYIFPNMALVATIFSQVFKEKRWQRFAWKPLENYKVWDEFLPGFERDIAALPVSDTDLGTSRKAAEKCRALIVDYLGIHVTSLAFASIFYQILDTLMRRWANVADPATLSALVANSQDNKTLETNRALWNLAKATESCPALQGRLREKGPLPTLEEIRDFESGLAFLDKFEQFLANFGHRSSASWEIFSPRWGDTPELPLGMIRNYLSAGLSLNPASQEENTTRARQNAERYILDCIAKNAPAGRKRLRLNAFHLVLKTARYYSLLRENQRFYFDRLLLKSKRVLEALGRQLHDRAHIPSASDIVHLTLEEVDDLMDGYMEKEDARALIESRRKQALADAQAKRPTFLKGEKQFRDDSEYENEHTLSGLGISPGRITGTVRIINNPTEGMKLGQGDILVTRATDPGWTPLFLTAGGLIMELGSLLSHGAVVAREYNLPAVVNISEATQRLKDGQVITLDGNRGMIYIH